MSKFSHIPAIEDSVTQAEIKDFRNNVDYKHPVAPPELNNDYNNIVILLGIPKIPQDKFAKLIDFMKKVFKKKVNVSESQIIDIFLPVDPNNPKSSLGFAFVELENTQLAKESIEKLNDFAFDSKHTVKTAPFSDLSKYSKLNSKKANTNFPEFKKKPFLKSWLKNTFEDQYLVKIKDKIEIFWNDIIKEGDSVFSNQKMTEGSIGWSPNGNYLITEHEEGYKLWGEEDFKLQARLKHQLPEFIEFSPRESYAVTVNDEINNNVLIWDIRMESISTRFSIPPAESNGRPLFRWSPDEKYFSRQKKNSDEIEIYLTQTFLPNKNKIQVKNLQDFSFCPSLVNGGSIIGYWTLDKETGYATIGLLSFPLGTVLGRPISLVDVKEVNMLWSKDGSFLAVKVVRDKRIRVGTNLIKTSATDFYVFRAMTKDFLVDHIEVMENVVDFEWEPNGNKLLVITNHKDEVGISIKNDVTLYTFEDENVKSDSIMQLTEVDKILWSPKGRHAVLIYTEAKTAKPILFWDLQEKEQLGYGEHYKMSNAVWDPSGRYLCTIVSVRSTADGEHGFIMWSFNGKILYKRQSDNFEIFSWRPRPPSILTQQQIEKVKKNLPSKIKQYEKEEQRKSEEERNELLFGLNQAWRDYILWKQELEDYSNEEKEERINLLGFGPDEDWVELSTTIEKKESK